MIDFIAEVSSNHNRDFERMKDFISQAKECGCSGVKFQLFKVSELFAPEILKKSKRHRDRIKWQLDESLIPELSHFTHQLGLKFSCTPFYIAAIEILNPYVDFFKIASYELLWEDLFIKCGSTGKQLVFSTGMAEIDEVVNILKILSNQKTKDIIILHCNSSYPTPIKDANLAGIETLKETVDKFKNLSNKNITIGYSDHTVSPMVLYNAIFRHNVKFIEFHMDLDGKGEEYESGHCWLPNQIKEMISNVKLGLIAEGVKDFGPSESERPDRLWRADPSDGMRPLKEIREKYNG